MVNTYLFFVQSPVSAGGVKVSKMQMRLLARVSYEGWYIIKPRRRFSGANAIWEGERSALG